MFRKLLIVFASGVILSIVAFSAAWLFGGDKFRQEFYDHDGWSWTIGEDDEDQGPRKSRSFTVEPGSQLAMEIPVELSFNRGDKAEMVVTGPANIVDRLIWENGRLSVPGQVHMRHGLKVKITAPEITGLDLDAPGDVTLVGMQQERFTLKSEGAVNLDAEGKVRKVFITTEGAGNIDLAKVEGEDATVRMDGVGNVTIGATGLVDVEINGAGHVTLVRKPETLRSQINGIGSVDHDY
ncbi:GIN domain-containing protein [Novosphingobium malaysiense]|uniref:Putative auto-transporter adhesin head GIN domain-containing protein n=1 Tax=Novosphingobium malaysiense TaxID=1348853 RepID=A0A0B1ZK47_9SPHN|nr:DUF2807 domain-containing protein [Novosphingobium malaysiense]KHK89628.1 hypothetical protein LK12_21380 [Novosphingobium malaysiense]